MNLLFFLIDWVAAFAHPSSKPLKGFSLPFTSSFFLSFSLSFSFDLVCGRGEKTKSGGRGLDLRLDLRS